jgi:hypothetical protein
LPGAFGPLCARRRRDFREYSSTARTSTPCETSSADKRRCATRSQETTCLTQPTGKKRNNLNQGWEVQGLRSRVKVLRFAFLGGKRFEVQGSTCQENFFKV